jgi:hypothetical protein
MTTQREPTGRPATGALPCLAPNQILRASPATATELRALAHSTLSKVGIFQKAGLGWRSANSGRSLTRIHVATLPSHWAF